MGWSGEEAPEERRDWGGSEWFGWGDVSERWEKVRAIGEETSGIANANKKHGWGGSGFKMVDVVRWRQSEVTRWKSVGGDDGGALRGRGVRRCGKVGTSKGPLDSLEDGGGGERGEGKRRPSPLPAKGVNSCSKDAILRPC